MSLMSLFTLPQQCPACLVRLTWIVFVMGGKWPYRCCFVGCYLQDLFNIAHSILVVLLWTPTYGRPKAGRPARTYIQHQREDTGCGPEDLPEAMDDREKWRERVSFFSIRLVSVHVVHLYSSIETTAAWKKRVYYHILNTIYIYIYICYYYYYDYYYY